MASGSEVSVTIKAAELLEADGYSVRVVSFPSWQLFEAQEQEYKERILPQSVKIRLSVEAGVRQGWERYVGDSGDSICIETFGHSAPEKIVMEKYGFTPQNISHRAKGLLRKVKKEV